MRYIQKFFKTKEAVREFIKENGMEEAVKEYGLNKLLMFKLIFQYEGTELYYDEYISYHRVYNKEGKFLGNITHLMAPHYKKLGYFYGPCLNGNIILYQNSQEQQGRTYGVFDKFGECLVPYGKYFNHCFLPSGVALMGKSCETEHTAVTVGYKGDIKNQEYTYIEKDETFSRVYTAYTKVGDTFKKYDIVASQDYDEVSQETLTTEEV